VISVTATSMNEAFEWLPLDEHLIGPWTFTVVPIAVCLLGVHLFFRHFVTIMWFSVKLLVAILVYLQLRVIVSSFLQTSRPWSLEETLFNLPTGTINTASVLGFRILKTKTLLFIHECYSGCNLWGPTTIPPEEYTSWVDWIGYTIFI